jgi:hypothetical protein
MHTHTRLSNQNCFSKLEIQAHTGIAEEDSTPKCEVRKQLIRCTRDASRLAEATEEERNASAEQRVHTRTRT